MEVSGQRDVQGERGVIPPADGTNHKLGDVRRVSPAKARNISFHLGDIHHVQGFNLRAAFQSSADQLRTWRTRNTKPGLSLKGPALSRGKDKQAFFIQTSKHVIFSWSNKKECKRAGSLMPVLGFEQEILGVSKKTRVT